MINIKINKGEVTRCDTAGELWTIAGIFMVR